MVGNIKILKNNCCNNKDCNCGWNLTLGGTDPDDLKLILKSIQRHNLEWAKLLAEGD